MKNLFLVKNPELFQGEKYLSKNKQYFEGWYFKTSIKNKVIAFIPGISTNETEKKAFIQVITNDASYYIDFPITEFTFNHSPFEIKIGNNTFSKNEIHIDINDINENITINGNLKYSNAINITSNNLFPNIMGPFSYIPFMECNHAILCMSCQANGEININNVTTIFKNGIGYIEKDWGTSFPKAYIWTQGNDFINKNISFMLSIANIPFKPFNFTGLIAVLLIDKKEYRFTTYNNGKIIKYKNDNGCLVITLKRGKYLLELKTDYDKGHKLIAPIKGKMQKNIYESISSDISITLKKNKEVIFQDTSKNCGLEIVK